MTTLARLLGAVREGRPPPVLDFLAEQRRRRTRPEDLPWWERPPFVLLPEPGEDTARARRPHRGGIVSLAATDAGPTAGAAAPASPSAGPDGHVAQQWHKVLAGDDMAAKLDAVRKLGDAAKQNPEALKGLDPVDRYMVELATDLIDKGHNPMHSVDAAERISLAMNGPGGSTGREALHERRAGVGAKLNEPWQEKPIEPETPPPPSPGSIIDRIANDVRESVRRMLTSVLDPSNTPVDPPGPDDFPPVLPPPTVRRPRSQPSGPPQR